MNDYYFTGEPASASRPQEAQFVYGGHTLYFTTDSGVFSKGELDKGTATLLCALPPLSGDVLDMGCGWGAMGIAVAKACPDARVTMADVNRRAIELARDNAQRNSADVTVLESDGFSGLSGSLFDSILSNPPIRAGKQVIYAIFREAAAHLREGGCMYLVIRKQQGAPSALTFLRGIYADVSVIEKSGGFWVLRAAK